MVTVVEEGLFFERILLRSITMVEKNDPGEPLKVLQTSAKRRENFHLPQNLLPS
jgi:hypothetical protein